MRVQDAIHFAALSGQMKYLAGRCSDREPLPINGEGEREYPLFHFEFADLSASRYIPKDDGSGVFVSCRDPFSIGRNGNSTTRAVVRCQLTDLLTCYRIPDGTRSVSIAQCQGLSVRSGGDALGGDTTSTDYAIQAGLRGGPDHHTIKTVFNCDDLVIRQHDLLGNELIK